MIRHETEFVGPRGDRLGCLVQVPRAFADSMRKRWPLVLFLHGGAERGNDLTRVERQGLPRIARGRRDLPFVLLSPQCPRGTTWADHLPALEGLVEEVVSSWRVDSRRIHLTGISMGGAGAWLLGARCPARFASVVPLCAPVPPVPGWPARAKRLTGVTVRSFHGLRDRAVPVEDALTLAAVLSRAGGNVRLSVDREAGHEIWDRIYGDPAVHPWFASRGRG